MSCIHSKFMKFGSFQFGENFHWHETELDLIVEVSYSEQSIYLSGLI